tara:strand:- start:9744 stop:10724 length:981 start_codon:yes stop_codon:yes gene_type:complete
MKELKTKISSREPIYDQVLFLDGVSRAGKFLLGKICSNFKRVEYFQYIESLEHFPILNSLGFIEKDAAKSMMQIYLDYAIYNMSIGRGLNQRLDDSSSITHATDFEDYVNRSKGHDGEEAIEKLKINNRLPSFLIHECMPFVEFFFETFPNLQMIHIERHPIDLAHSWFSRGLGKRFGLDPLVFAPTLQSKKGPIPWHAESWKDLYADMSEVDRAIKSVCNLYMMSDKSYEKINSDRKDRILKLGYENFFSSPNTVIEQLSKFLESSPYSNMGEVLKREGCHSEIPLSSRQAKLKELKNSASKEIFEELTEASAKYESYWDLEKSY